MIVVDASVLLEVLLNRPIAREVTRRLSAAGETLHAPHLIDIEVTHAVRRFVLTGRLPEARGQQAVLDFGDIRLGRYPHTRLLPRIWELRHNLSAYDAAYVALAEALDAPLLTRDTFLAAAPGHRAQVELI